MSYRLFQASFSLLMLMMRCAATLADISSFYFSVVIFFLKNLTQALDLADAAARKKKWVFAVSRLFAKSFTAFLFFSFL